MRRVTAIMMTLVAWLSVAASATDAAEQAEGESPPPASWIEAAKAAQSIEDMSADFEQAKHSPLFDQPMISRGRVRQWRGVSRWDTLEPEPTVMHVDDKAMSLYYPADRVVEIYPHQEQWKDIAGTAVPPMNALTKRFHVESIALPQPQESTPKHDDESSTSSDDASAGESNNTSSNTSDNASNASLETKAAARAFRLTPRAESLRQHIASMTIIMNIKYGMAHEIAIVGAEGDRTVIRFTHIRLNQKLEAKDVALQLPLDVRTVRPLEGQLP